MLTVSYLDDFVARGGIIGIYKSDNRLRFRVNVNAARHASPKIGSKPSSLFSGAVSRDGSSGDRLGREDVFELLHQLAELDFQLRVHTSQPGEILLSAHQLETRRDFADALGGEVCG